MKHPINTRYLASLVPSTVESQYVRQRQLVRYASRSILCHPPAAKPTRGLAHPPRRSTRRAGKCMFGAARAVKTALQLHFLPPPGKSRRPHDDALQPVPGCGGEVVPGDTARAVREMSEALAR
ncbi:hypothetical protein Y032_0257g418 [Ancylostoma ceylanicum]|uniref:Uncharacterized protein n=1 Tax=Ancylostoma ceylanicum TaxID=53326 RepID=A0A016SAV9_9BILA|nr:hypothetical protein Y032_0257g418 [Ancylostoma ceylanicum]